MSAYEPGSVRPERRKTVPFAPMAAALEPRPIGMYTRGPSVVGVRARGQAGYEFGQRNFGPWAHILTGQGG